MDRHLEGDYPSLVRVANFSNGLVVDHLHPFCLRVRVQEALNMLLEITYRLLAVEKVHVHTTHIVYVLIGRDEWLLLYAEAPTIVFTLSKGSFFSLEDILCDGNTKLELVSVWQREPRAHLDNDGILVVLHVGFCPLDVIFLQVFDLQSRLFRLLGSHLHENAALPGRAYLGVLVHHRSRVTGYAQRAAVNVLPEEGSVLFPNALLQIHKD